MTSRKLSTLGYALLGLVHGEPRTGYAIMKIFRTTPMGHYSGSPGAIYPALRGLQRDGLVRGRPRRTGRPGTVLEITPKGVRRLASWLRRSVTRADVIWRLDELMLRFAYMEQLLARREVVRFLEGLGQELDEYVGVLETHRATRSQTLHSRLALTSGIDGYRVQARWTRHAVRQIRKGRRAALKGDAR
jgi:DNA-binding PadR family transcriptional regulator